jgi:hypothetical protein
MRVVSEVGEAAGRVAAEARGRSAVAPRPAGRRVLPALLRWLGVAAGALVLFAGYLRLSRGVPVNADGASNALQAWDMLHGNPLLRGWTVSDVSFYSTELPQYALIELWYELRPDVVHVAAAMTYTLLVLLAAAVARGRATGVEALVRVGIVVAIMLVPAPGVGYETLLLSPDHTGTAVPLLVTWLVLDRLAPPADASDGARPAPRRLPYVIAALLVWAQVGDPLALFIGALPLVVVSGWRLWRDGRRRPRQWRGTDARLFVAGVAAVLVTQAVLMGVWLAGGFRLHPPIAEFSRLGDLAGHFQITIASLGTTYGIYSPHWSGPVDAVVVVLNTVGLLLAVAAIAFGVVQVCRYRRGVADDRVADVLTVAILINLAAFIVSTQPDDLLSARQIVAVLPFGAALAGRLLGQRRLFLGEHSRPARRLGRLPVTALAAALVLLGGAFATHAATARPAPAEAQDAADWLAAHGHTYGIGGYWAANTTRLRTKDRVGVAPVIGVNGRIHAYRWESRADWYDPGRHDARFLMLDLKFDNYGTPEEALAQFGAPVERRDFGRFAVLIYDRNLLVGLPAHCGPRTAPSLDRCPDLMPRLPGSTLLSG